jgi:hypothetical protein
MIAERSRDVVEGVTGRNADAESDQVGNGNR